MNKLKQIFNKDLRIVLGLNVVLALILTFVIESMARQSAGGGLDFLVHSPLIFILNALIVFATLFPAILVKRRLFAWVVLCGTWLGLGITNGVILSNRMTPFTTKDLTILEDGLDIIPNYLSTKRIIILCVGIALLVAFLILLFWKGPKRAEKISWPKYIATSVVIVAIAIGSIYGAVKAEILDTYFSNLAYAYRDNGFSYCFLNTWLNTGVSRPVGYSEDMIKGIFNEGELSEDGTYHAEVRDEDAKKPNIVIVQLESFIDPSEITSIKCSEEATPNFRKLADGFSSGYFTVPSVGAGTANTEFEVLSGMSTKFFGPGEYPYKGILKEETCETAAYILRNMGYRAHAIHNHRGAFYCRNEVYPNLGFDSFTSLEYMNHVVKTPKNWAKDSILTNEIMSALTSDEEKDFVFTVSVQGHGKYPVEQVIANPAITVEAKDEETKWQYEYYVNQIYEMDQWVGELTDTLSKFKEDTVLLLYGDHLPALEMTAEEMKSGNLNNTEYVLWSNFKMKEKDKDLYSYQIMAEIFDRIGIDDGTLFTYHRHHQEDEKYLPNLKALQYDMLYGRQYIYGGKTPFEPVKMRMGINPIRIEEVVQIGENYYIKGQNFTQYSKISLDGEILSTIYLGPTVLGLLEEVDPEDVSRMKVSQVEKYKEILSTTE